MNQSGLVEATFVDQSEEKWVTELGDKYDHTILRPAGSVLSSGW